MGKIDRFLRAKVFPRWRIPPSRGFYRLAWSDLIALSSVQLAQQVFAVHPNASQFSRSKAALWSEWLSTVHLKRFCSGWELNPKHSCCAVITVTTKRQFPCLTNNIKIPVNVKLWCHRVRKKGKRNANIVNLRLWHESGSELDPHDPLIAHLLLTCPEGKMEHYRKKEQIWNIFWLIIDLRWTFSGADDRTLCRIVRELLCIISSNIRHCCTISQFHLHLFESETRTDFLGSFFCFSLWV